MAIDFINILDQDHIRFEVFLDGHKQLNCVEARVGPDNRPGYVVQLVLGANGQPLLGSDGKPVKKTQWGLVELREIV